MRGLELTITVTYKDYQDIERNKRFLWQPDRQPLPIDRLPTSETLARLSVVFYCAAIQSLRCFHLLRLVPQAGGIELQLA
ncbi:MAG: hypothetical protein ABF586_13160 [Sporolactobacillus sp.]